MTILDWLTVALVASYVAFVLSLSWYVATTKGKQRNSAEREALERIAAGDFDTFSADPSQWPNNIARAALSSGGDSNDR